MLVVCRRVNRISVGLTNRTLLASKSSFRRERLLNPMPRTDTTVPAGNEPSPGLISEMAARVFPLTVTMPGSTRALTIAPLKYQSDGDSSATWVRLPTAASGRIRNDTVEDRRVARDRLCRHVRNGHVIAVDHGGAGRFAVHREHADANERRRKRPC